MPGPVSRRPARPERLGAWQVIAKIAGGGMSSIYLGRRVDPPVDPHEPGVVALKIVRQDLIADEHVLHMFIDEGKLLSRLVHPNIVRTLEVGNEAGQAFIAMELLLGTTLAEVQDAMVARGSRLHPELAAWITARVGDALQYAHDLSDEAGAPLSLIHRDVNPANVFVTFGGEVKLFDFGMAKVRDRAMASSPNIVKGKLPYLSPEQVMQLPLDSRSDIFALGTTLWELLTAKRLFRRDSDMDTVRAVHVGPIPDVRESAPDVPDALARIVRRSLERKRENRYQSAAEMARELDELLGSADLAGRVATVTTELFPAEAKRQGNWLKPAVSPPSSRQPRR